MDGNQPLWLSNQSTAASNYVKPPSNKYMVNDGTHLYEYSVVLLAPLIALADKGSSHQSCIFKVIFTDTNNFRRVLFIGSVDAALINQTNRTNVRCNHPQLVICLDSTRRLNELVPALPFNEVLKTLLFLRSRRAFLEFNWCRESRENPTTSPVD
jgi:hypothetical protein